MRAKLSVIARVFRIYRNLPKPWLLSNTLASIAGSLLPFVNIYMSAQIINELVANRNTDRIIMLVAITIGLNLAVSLISRAFDRWASYCGSEAWVQTYAPVSFKMMDMDYADAEDTSIKQRQEEIRGHHMGMGFGLSAIHNAYRPALDSLMRVMLSVAFAFSLFTMRIPENSPLAWLDSWWAIGIMIFALFISVIISPVISALGLRVFATASEMNSAGNRHFGFYYWTVTLSKERAKDIRIYNQQSTIDREAGDGFMDKEWMALSRKVDKYSAIGSAVGQLANGAIYLYIAGKALAGAFPVGSVVQYVGAIFQFGQSVGTLIMQIGRLMSAVPYMEKATDFLDIPNKKYLGTIHVEKRTDNKYILEFKNVSFKYPGSETYALRNLSLKFELGKKLAVVGQNGSGKTTMIKLLTRLYDPTEGEITLNGIPIWKYNYDEYMNIFGVVLQDFALLPFTLGQNIASDTTYDPNRANECLTAAGFDERMEKLPHGLDTYIYKSLEEEGIEPSGGEEQKIALARALYKNAPFIVLDEPTAALDPIAEHEIYTRFNAIVGDKTAVYISHRLSSCRFCDDIIVFHEGTAIQRGTHDELLINTTGKYSELWNAQAQYYTENDAAT